MVVTLLSALTGLPTAPRSVATGPMWTDYASAWSAIVAVAIGIPALLVTVQQTRLTKRAEIAQLFARLDGYIREWDSTGMLEARKKVNQLTREQLRDRIAVGFSGGPKKADRAVELLQIPNYFEHLGWIAEYSSRDAAGAIDAALGPLILAEWSHWQPTAEMLRRNNGDPSVYLEFERLAARSAARAKSLSK